MNERLFEFHELSVHPLVVSFAAASSLAAHKEQLNLDIPVASDPSRAAYRDYGLERGSFARVWHPRTIWHYIRSAVKGERPTLPRRGDDLAQLGGDFIVSASRKIAFAFRSERPDHRPGVDELLRHCESLTP